MIRNASLLRGLAVAIVLASSLGACEAISGRETAGEYVDDTTITTKVKASITNELGLKKIGVQTMQNVVQLSGFVDSMEIKTRAGDIARNTSGVKSVTNSLVVR